MVLGVYLQTLHALLINIIQLHFIRAHFINILCCYFVSIFTRILWTFYILHFTEIFFLEFFITNILRFYKDFNVRYGISVNWVSEWKLLLFIVLCTLCTLSVLLFLYFGLIMALY